MLEDLANAVANMLIAKSSPPPAPFEAYAAFEGATNTATGIAAFCCRLKQFWPLLASITDNCWVWAAHDTNNSSRPALAGS